MRIRLTPDSPTAGGTRVFEVVRAKHDTRNGQLTLTGRDGRICLGLVGGWEVEMLPSQLVPMGVDEMERIHDGRALVVMAH